MLNSKYNENPRLAHSVYLWFQAYVEAICNGLPVWRLDTHQPSKFFTYRSE
jgi:hypothetical protein